MKRTPLIATIICLLFLSACTSSLKKVQLDGLQEKIVMDKGACIGPCSVYTLTVYDNGLAAYEGKKNTERSGLFIKRLSTREMERLFNEFREVNLWQFQDVYRGSYLDSKNQTVSITFYDGGSSKKVLGKSSRPQGVLSLENKLDAIAKTDGWLALNPDDGQTDPEIVVQLKEGANVKSWARKYSGNKLEVVDNYGDRNYSWLVKFDANTISSEQLLQKIRRDQSVLGAQILK